MRKLAKAINALNDNKIPARIHAILAREADKAVVFRRGPSSKTAILEWDLQADKFKLGQWFYGSFYPYRCDISPDGRHLVYFAAKYGRGSSIDKYITERVEAETGPFSWKNHSVYFRRRDEIAADAKTGKEIERQVRAGEYYDCSWTAISRVPYLKAVDLWFNGSGWNGGGLFIDNKRVAINHPPHTKDVRRNGGRFIEVAPPNFCEGWGQCGGECPMGYFPRLVRDGWKWTSRSAELDVFEKPLSRGLTLRKMFHCVWNSKSRVEGRGVYWESHKICAADGNVVVDGVNWSWADFDKHRKRVVFAESGSVFALHTKNIDGAPQKLHDFNDMKYERIQAPY